MNKDLTDNVKISLPSDENESQGQVIQVFPEIDCTIAIKHFADYHSTRDLGLSATLELLSHLTQKDFTHKEDCPYHQEGTCDDVTQLFDEKFY